MGTSINFDFGGAYAQICQQLSELFGQDPDSLRWKATAQRWVNLSAEQAETIQCIGMSVPIPMDDIYQPCEIVAGEESVSIESLISSRKDAVILAGPGYGKTTFLRWAYRHLATTRTATQIPLLVTLRWPNAVKELEGLIDQINRYRDEQSFIRSKLRREGGSVAAKQLRDPNTSIILLVDGYDEVSLQDRQSVSTALASFRASALGRFYITCRSGYDILNLNVAECHIKPFSREAALRFIRQFSRSYSKGLDALELYEQLRHIGLSTFAEHPLLLAMVCIVRSESVQLPRRVIDLIKRAIDQLSFEWDYSKGVRRESTTPLSAIHRLNILKYVAHNMTLRGSGYAVEKFVGERLTRLGFPSADAREVLKEIHQWYGLLVPAGFEEWQFVHRSIQDYLAACYELESGILAAANQPLTSQRAAYAMALAEDATPYICRLLMEESQIVDYFRTFLENGGIFDLHVVSDAVIARVGRLKAFSHRVEDNRLWIGLREDFFCAATDEFLRVLVVKGGRQNTLEGECVAAYALAELFGNRLQPVAPVSLTAHSFEGRLERYLTTPGLEVSVHRAGVVEPFTFNPHRELASLMERWKTR